MVTPTPPTVTPTVYLFDVTVGGSLLTKRSKLKVRFSLTKAATVRFSITRRGSKKALSTWTKTGRSGANTVTITRRLPDRADAQAGLLHAQRRPQRDRDQLAVDPSPIARRSVFGSGTGDR